MPLPFSVDETPTREVFIRTHQLIGFVLLIVIALWLFYPEENLMKHIDHAETVDPITINYLENLMLLYPEQERVILSLAHAYIKSGRMQEAHMLLQEKHYKRPYAAQWLLYRLLRHQHFSKSTPNARDQVQLLRENIISLAKAPLAPHQQIRLAQDAEALSMSHEALTLYHKILTHGETLSKTRKAKLAKRAAKLALSHRHYQQCADFYSTALKLSDTLDTRRDAFVKGVQCLQAGDMIDKAMTYAKTHMGKLSHDKKTLMFLTELALAANKPAIAQEHMKRLLKKP